MIAKEIFHIFSCSNVDHLVDKCYDILQLYQQGFKRKKTLGYMSIIIHHDFEHSFYLEDIIISEIFVKKTDREYITNTKKIVHI